MNLSASEYNFKLIWLQTHEKIKTSIYNQGILPAVNSHTLRRQISAEHTIFFAWFGAHLGENVGEELQVGLGLWQRGSEMMWGGVAPGGQHLPAAIVIKTCVACF